MMFGGPDDALVNEANAYRALRARLEKLAEEYETEPDRYLAEMKHPIDGGFALACQEFARRLRDLLKEGE
jgi:hypothetical protein